TVRVTDNGVPSLNDTKNFTVVVNEVNSGPVLATIGNQTINEGSLLTLTAMASDADVPANSLTYSLEAGAPAGARINARRGVPSLNDTKSFTVVVNEVNSAPVLAALGNQTINEGATLTFTVSATDADLPANSLTYSLEAGAPAGASINSTTGLFSWTPSENQ